MAPNALAQVLRKIPKLENNNILIGYDNSDDACVYRINDSLASVMTVDFFPPMVDDPRHFGRIAAANALSDIYAMGGTPSHAMNLLCFPNCLDLSVAEEILAGGAEKASEAGCPIVGGHTINDDEPKYGLCVHGFVNPDRILTNAGAEDGDELILTKKIGTGAIVTGYRNGFLDEEEIQETIDSMETLNRRASELALPHEIHACTDVTGFGLIGHLCEMAEGSGLAVELETSNILFLEHAVRMSQEEMLPGGAERNRLYFGKRVVEDASVEACTVDLLYDPQTSGGLIFAVKQCFADDLHRILCSNGIPSQRIGRMTKRTEDILVRIK